MQRVSWNRARAQRVLGCSLNGSAEHGGFFGIARGHSRFPGDVLNGFTEHGGFFEMMRVRSGFPGYVRNGVAKRGGFLGWKIR